MAVPKGKQSKSRTNKRFANYKVAHRVCKNCGYYDGKEVVAQKEAKD